MMRPLLTLALRNVGLLMVVVVPTFFVLFLLQVAVSSKEMFRDVPDALTFAGMAYLSTAIPICASGLAHQVLCFLLPREWSPTATRAVVFGSALLIPVVTVLVSFDSSFVAATISAIAVPAVISLALYTAVLRMPQKIRGSVAQH